MCVPWAEERGRGTLGIRARLRQTGCRQWGSEALGWNSVQQLRE